MAVDAQALIDAIHTDAQALIAAIDTIRKFARTNTDRPHDVLQTVEVMLASLRDALNGKMTLDMLTAELAALVDVHGREVSKQPTPIDDKFDPERDQ